MNGLAGKSVPFLRNIKLSSTDHGRIRYVLYFPKIYHSGEEGALITFVYIQIRHPSHSSPSVFEGQGYCGWGGKQNRPAPKDDPCSISFRCGLIFF